MDLCQPISRYVLTISFSVYITHPAKHDLPKLGNVGNIRDLSSQECNAYLAGYGLRHVHSIDERKRSIGREVGCPVRVV
jgi:hypothetical protein